MFMVRSSWSAALLEPLARLVYIPVKHEEPIAVSGGRVAELVLLSFAALDFQRLRQIVHLEQFNVCQRQRKPVVLVIAVVTYALRRGHETALARSEALFV